MRMATLSWKLKTINKVSNNSINKEQITTLKIKMMAKIKIRSEYDYVLDLFVYFYNFNIWTDGSLRG